MGRLTTNVGLVSGFPIQSTVDQLIALQAAPRDALQTATTALQNQQAEVTNLAGVVVSLQSLVAKLALPATFQQRTASSSNVDVVGVTVNGSPATGNYQYTPLALAQSNQFVSSKLVSSSAALGSGTFSFGFGGTINPGVGLDLLNSGNGVDRGSIKITDRSGASATIDLTATRNIDEVIAAINKTTSIKVTASTSGDHLVLTDKTGLTTSNLKVEEVNGGTVASSLGLASINANSSSAAGSDILTLFNDLSLDSLNDGRGVRLDAAQPDLKVHFADGTESTIDFRALGVAGTRTSATTTATNGVNATIKFTAVTPGSATAGTLVSFVNDNAVQAGQETVSYDAQTKKLTFKIHAGQTTADDVIAALKRDPVAVAAFTAARGAGGAGNGVVTTNDTAVTTGPQSTAQTVSNTNSNANILFAAVQGGASSDNVTVQFVDNPSITAGSETVAFDNSNPSNKKLIFQISAGHTTANQVIAALNNDPTAKLVFTAARATGASGAGLVSASDTAVTSGGAIVEPVAGGDENTVGQVLAALNAAAPTKLRAAISADGDHIQLTDLTTGSDTFALTQLNNSHIVDDLGLGGAPSGGVITSGRLLGGLQTSLLANLNGGAGFGSLGDLNITNRQGSLTTVSLASAKTLDDVIDAINGAGSGVQARVNDARNGLLLTDTTGSTAGNLIVANGDGNNSADKLGLTVNAAVSSKSSGSLHLQTVSTNTLLANYNGGGGVASGTFSITDSAGATKTLNLTAATTTVGQLIDQINTLGLAVHAQINDNGDGIALQDTAHGTGTLKVVAGAGTTARDLHLLTTAQTQTIGGTPTQVVDGSTITTIAIGATDSLQNLVDKINAQGLQVAASILNDGSKVRPFQLSLSSLISGRDGALQIDASQASFSVQETVKAQDAVVLYGPGNGQSSILASSSTNQFANLTPGLSINVKSVSTTPISVNVSAATSDLTSSLQAVVDTYNRLHAEISKDTTYDTKTSTRGLLQNDSSVLGVDQSLTNLFSGRSFNATGVRSFGDLGISIGQDGTLSFDSNKLQSTIAANPTGVSDFFTKSTTGFAAQIKTLSNQFATGNNSTLAVRSTALLNQISDNNDRITFLNARLDSSRQRLLLSFQNMELAISKIQANSAAINSVAALASSLSGTTSSSSTSSSGISNTSAKG